MTKQAETTSWPLQGRAVRLIVVLSLGFCILHGIAQILTFLSRHTLYQMDFFGLWSFARFARTHSAALLYQPAVLDTYKHTLAPSLDGFYPFPYPPDFLLFIWPFGALPYGAAQFFGLAYPKVCAYVYDSTAIAAALLVFAEFVAAQSGYFKFSDIIICILAFLLPVDVGPEHRHFVFSSVAYLLLFVLIVRFAQRTSPQPQVVVE